VRSRTLVSASAVVASALVLSALPGRQHASRSATEALVPMRDLTAEEASALLRAPTAGAATVISVLTETTVVLETQNYVIARADHGHNPGEQQFTVTRATWKALYSRYELPRRELERALGRSLSADPVRPTRFADLTLSFDADLVPEYALIEIAFTTAWLALLGFALLHVRRFSLVLPLAWLWLLLPVPFVAVYSPAFFDGDFFFQRILVERIALTGMLAGRWLGLPAALSALVFAALRLAEALAARGQTGAASVERVRRYRRGAGLALLGLALCFAALRGGQYWLERGRCLSELEALGKRLTQPNLAAALALPKGFEGNLQRRSDIPASARSAIESILGELEADRELVVLVRTNREPTEHLFLWRSLFRYADLRSVPPDFDRMIDAVFLRTLNAEARCSSLFESLRSQSVICGRSARFGEHTVTYTVKWAKHR
jgi:hypothetical protein